MAATLWFYVRDDKRQGPVDFEHLVSMLLTGQIPHSALVWHQGLREWAEAGGIPEIAEQLPPPLPQVPKPQRPAAADGASRPAPSDAAPPSAPSAASPRIEDLRKRLEKEPSSRLFAQLAEELRKDGQLEEAIGICRTGLQKHPNYPSARMTLGRSLIDSGDLVAARAELEAVLQGAPDNILARKLLDECVAALGPDAGAAGATPPEPTGKWWRTLWGADAPPPGASGAGRAATPAPVTADPPPTVAAEEPDEEEVVPRRGPDEDLPPIPLVAADDEPFELAAPYEGPVMKRPATAGTGDTGPLSVVPPPAVPKAPPPLPSPGSPPRKTTTPSDLTALLEDDGTAGAPRIFVPSLLPPTGSLADTDFPDLIHGLHDRRWTGTIEMNRGRVDTTVIVQGGRLTFATSTNRDERLGELLLRREKITLRQYHDAGRAIRKGKRLGALLVEQGALDARELVKVVVDHTQEVIYSVFLWTEGFYRLREGADANTESITLKLSTANLILEGIRRITAWSRIERGVGGPEARYVRAEDYKERLPEMTLTPEKLLLLAGHEGERDVDTMCRESELSDYEVCRTIWAFRVIGVLKQVPPPNPPKP